MTTTFVQDETGLDTANPIELYRFSGSLVAYTYTSGNREMTFHAPSATLQEDYKPIAMNRSEVILGDITDRNELKIMLPINIAIVADYVFDIAPVSDLTVEIYRQNGATGAWNLIFAGVVSGIGLRNNQATLTCPSVFTNYLDSEFPNVFYQSMCNLQTYSTRCGAVKADFTTFGVINAINDDGTLVVNAAGTFETNYFAPGEIITGVERRLILAQTGDILTINYQFRSLTVGDAVSLVAGDDHSITTCNDKFDQMTNFVGWPYIPYINPFLVGVQ